MHAEYLVINDAAETQEVKEVCEGMPNSRIAVLSRAFCIEAIRLRDSSALMVSPDEVHSLRIAEF